MAWFIAFKETLQIYETDDQCPHEENFGSRLPIRDFNGHPGICDALKR